MALADIHIHLLFGVDDGAKDEDEMRLIKLAHGCFAVHLISTPATLETIMTR